VGSEEEEIPFAPLRENEGSSLPPVRLSFSLSGLTRSLSLYILFGVKALSSYPLYFIAKRAGEDVPGSLFF